ncbi:MULTISPECIES: hypothetical protein [Haloferax]|uniref:DUF8119 domain-containing protein n=2 Tax=Haloferax TaxID=2251 RepID=A0A1H7PV51_HALLR|nr:MULTISPECIES: hypothetical protein [Haloferax]ELZ80511.1 hypothetical protein C455_06556 [Haloferax larsenii JCM 13917]ELZ84794.1 hypothetical protein C453_12286 [Haloferax elongans ATCC BAA-1513]SEL39358.1 hypothetical protein SAMN04488691_104203 [Haloferax larsenii]
MSLVQTIRDHVATHRSEMVTDLLFALAWVTVVSLLFDVVDGPQWAFYLCLAAGVVAHYGFFASVEAAR